MPSTARTSSSSSLVRGSSLAWRFTKIMNMSDLSRDDDFLSHLLVEKLGTGSVPLLVHKMDPSRRLPKTDADDLLQIVRRLVVAKGQPATAVREAVDDLLLLTPIRYYLRSYAQKQVNAFATHASRYLELYLPSGSIEIAHTSRYAHATGKSELCILAAKPLAAGTVITELKGSMADLTDDEDRELKRATTTGLTGIRRDFSVIHSKQLKKNHLFLGPARFVNHDCDNNVELFREGRYITFRVIKPIGVGEEVTAHYGEDYFGRNNRHCLCQSCEKVGRGGYNAQDTLDPSSPSDSDSDASSSPTSESEEDVEPVNVNERRTRRGVYTVLPETRKPEGSVTPTIVLEKEENSPMPSALLTGLATPESILPSRASSISSSLTSLSADVDQLSRKGLKRMIPIRPSTQLPQILTEEAAMPTDIIRSVGLPTPPSSTETPTPTPSVRSSARLQAKGSGQHDPVGRSSQLATPTVGDGDRHNSSKSRKSDAEAQESRVLRPRPSLANPAESSKLSSKGEKPSKPAKKIDKRLPTCSTCTGILPVISVDSEIVWGLEGFEPKRKGKGKNKAQQKHECPRCLRHFAIYCVPWPHRTPSNGGTAFSAMPRQEIIRTSSKSSNSHDRSASVLTSRSAKDKSKARRDQTEEDNRPSKKTKLDPAFLQRGRAQISSKSRSILGVNKTRSGRPHLPSRKMRESPHSPNSAQAKKAVKEESLDPDVRVLGESPRIETVFSRRMITYIVKRSRAERATARTRLRAEIEKKSKVRSGETGETSNRTVVEACKKRSRDSDAEDKDEPPYRRTHPPTSDDESDVSSSEPYGHSSMMGVQRSRYNGASNLLSKAPNPLLFARRKWVPIVPPDPDPEIDSYENVPSSSRSSTDDETDGPVTPEDNELINSSPSIEVDYDEGGAISPRAKALLGRTMKPSPVNFAMKRWSSLSDGPRVPLTEGPSLPAVEDLDRNKLCEPEFAADEPAASTVRSPTPDNNNTTSENSSTPEKFSTYFPSWIWEDSSGQSQPGSPDSSLFVLRRKASFGSSPALGSVTDDSDNVVEQLLSAESPHASDIPSGDDLHTEDKSDVTMDLLENTIRLITDTSQSIVSAKVNGTATILQCTASPFTLYMQKEDCSPMAALAAPFVPSSPPSRLVKAGWDMDVSP